MRITIQSDGTGKRVRFEPGYYMADVVDVEEKTSQTGNPMMILVLQLITPEGERTPGRNFRYYLPFTPKSQWKIEGALHACGVDLPEIGEELDVEADMFLGCTVVAQTERQIGNKGPFLTVANVMRPGTEPHLGPMTEEELSKAGLGPDGIRTASGSRQSTPEKQTPAPAPAPAFVNDDDDDDIPF